MALTVGQLIEKLQALPQDAKVMVYCSASEDADYAHSVQHGGERPYVKGDWPDADYDKETRTYIHKDTNAVIIR